MLLSHGSLNRYGNSALTYYSSNYYRPSIGALACILSKMSVLRKAFSRRILAYVSAGSLLLIGGGYSYLNSGPAYPASTKVTRRPPPPWTPPSRSEMLKELKASASISKGTSFPQGEEFDLLIVGGGATGAGCAVDAASRGLKVALIERDDFGAGTS